MENEAFDKLDIIKKINETNKHGVIMYNADPTGYDITNRDIREFLIKSDGMNIKYMDKDKLAMHDKILAISSTTCDADTVNVYTYLDPEFKNAKLISAFAKYIKYAQYPLLEYLDSLNMLDNISEQFLFTLIKHMLDVRIFNGDIDLTHNIKYIKQILTIHPEYGNGTFIKKYYTAKSYSHAINIAFLIANNCGLPYSATDDISYIIQMLFGDIDISDNIASMIKYHKGIDLEAMLAYLIAKYPAKAIELFKNNLFRTSLFPKAHSDIFKYINDECVFNSLTKLLSHVKKHPNDIALYPLITLAMVKLSGNYKLDKLLNIVYEIYTYIMNFYNEEEDRDKTTAYVLSFILNNVSVISEKASSETILKLKLAFDI